MVYTFTCEIPKDGERRIHLNYARTEFIDCGAIIAKITVNEGKMPSAYGFLKGVINTDEKNEHEEYVDAFMIDTAILSTGEEVGCRVVGMFEREDGDHKVLVCSPSSNVQQFDDINEDFQKTLLSFHGFHKRIIKIHNTEDTEIYLSQCKRD
jgi:inorganic pyrophosphatase